MSPNENPSSPHMRDRKDCFVEALAESALLEEPALDWMGKEVIGTNVRSSLLLNRKRGARNFPRAVNTPWPKSGKICRRAASVAYPLA
jgi:hypothetical protein